MRENLNDSIHRVGTIESAFGAMNDFNFLNVVERQVGEIDEPAGQVDGRAVHKDLGVIRVAAIEKERSLAALGARAAQAEAGLRGERIGKRSRAALLHILEREMRACRGGAITLQREGSRRDDHFGGCRLKRHLYVHFIRLAWDS